ncbi:MAG: hypothetical protein MJ252_30890 [archaeon]|nr:hypothetical protein [archaeon]
MAEREDLFLKILQDNYPDLYQMALQKKYKILVPQKRCIIETMLNRNFYDNHIFNVSRFDDSMYVNLNGKVLKLDNQKFTSYLGWKKDMEFSIKDQFVVDQDLSCILIDNVCDDSNYNKTTSSSQSSTKIPLKRFSTMKEYIEYYNTKAFDFNEFKEAYDMLEYKTDFLRNNIIFMRNHEEDYSVYFNTEIRDIQDSFKNALSKIKSNISSLDILVAELVDSLVFDKMYDFIFNSLIDFHKEEENEIKNKMKEYPGKYDLANQQVDKAYRDCKFEKAVALLKEMSEKKNVFEKLVKYFFFIFSYF